MSKMTEFNEMWNPAVNRLGRATILPVIACCFLPNIYLYMVYGFLPPLDVMMNTWMMVFVVFGAFYIVEPMAYYPILGLAGTYISFLSGNISNMRVPCSAVAQEVVGVEPETPEAEIVSTLGITGSVVTNIIAVSLAAVIGAQLLSVFPTSVIAAFQNYAAPAIFGAVFGQFAVQSLRTAAIALCIPILLYIVGSTMGVTFLLKPWLMIMVTIFSTIAITRFFYQKEKAGK